MRRSTAANLAVLSVAVSSLAWSGCVTEESHSEQITLAIPAGSARVVLLGTGGNRHAVDPRGLPRDPASLVLLPTGAGPIVIDPWPGCGAKIRDVQLSRPRGPEEGPLATPDIVLVTTATAEVVAGILELAALAPGDGDADSDGNSAGAPRPRLVVTQSVLEQILQIDRTAVRPYAVVVAVAGAPVDLDNRFSATAIEIAGSDAVALKVFGPVRTMLYMPHGALPESAKELDALILGVDAAFLDGSGVGRGQDPVGVLDRCLRWGVPRGNVLFTSITLEEPGFPEEAVAVGGALAEDGFEIWL